MKILQLIDNVKSYNSIEDKLIIRFKNGSVTINDFAIIDIFKNAKDVFFKKIDVVYYIFHTSEEKILTNERFEVVKTFDRSSVFWDDKILNSNFLKLFSPTLEFNEHGKIIYNLKIVNLKTGEVKFEIGKIPIFGFVHFISDNFVYSFDESKTYIQTYTLPKAQLLWQFDLSHIGTYKNSSNENKPYEVKKFLGVWQDYLIISLTNDELLIINSKDGQFVNKLNKIPLQKMAEYTVDYLGSCMMLNQAEGKIKGFVNFVFWEFNLSNFTFECFNLAETIAQNNLSSLMNITSFAQSVTHYFVTMLKIDDTGSMTSYLVALNKQTKNFDWKYEIPWTGNNAPQYSGNKLYQLDNLHTLHIFQKD